MPAEATALTLPAPAGYPSPPAWERGSAYPSSQRRFDRLAELVAAVGGKAGIGPPGDRKSERAADDEAGHERHGGAVEHLADDEADQRGPDRADQALQRRGGA